MKLSTTIFLPCILLIWGCIESDDRFIESQLEGTWEFEIFVDEEDDNFIRTLTIFPDRGIEGQGYVEGYWEYDETNQPIIRIIYFDYTDPNNSIFYHEDYMPKEIRENEISGTTALVFGDKHSNTTGNFSASKIFK